MPANFLNPVNFQFSMSRLPTTVMHIQRVSLPGVSLPPVIQKTPLSAVHYPGDSLEYDEFSITFRVSENMADYIELYNWLRALGTPESLSEASALANGQPGSEAQVVSDATLTLINSAMNPIINISFTNAFPTSLSEISLDTQQNDVEYVDCTASFRYDTFSISAV